MTARSSLTGGMLVFSLIWLGQAISLVGSGLTEFALGVWVYQRTGVATDFALIVFFITLPHVAVSPIAGAIVDRWDRRLVMVLSDSGAALSSLSVAALAWSGALDVWHVYVAALVTSTCAAFQFPAYASLISRLVPKAQLGRANGMVELAWAGGQVASPILAAALLGAISLHGIILLDVLTFAVGVTALLLVRVPRSEIVAEAPAPHGSLLREAAYGWRFIVARPGLRGLLGLFVVINFGIGLFNGLFAPMVLAFAPAEVLGTIMSIGGSGLLLGGLLMTVWGGPRRRLAGILVPVPLLGICMVAMGLQAAPAMIAVAGFLYLFVQPFVNGCDQALWQCKVPHDVQGRVFATRRAIEYSSVLLAYLVAGPLADRLFTPLLVEGGPLAASVGQVLGVGPGRGIGLLFVLAGLGIVLVSAWGWASPRIRRLEEELLDAGPDPSADVAPARAEATGLQAA